MRATGWLAVVAVWLAALLPASTEAKEEVVYLPGTGLRVGVECKVSLVERSDLRKDRAGREFGTDTLELQLGDSSFQYQLTLMPKGTGDVSLCDDPVAQVERLQGAWVARADWLPATLRPKMLENREDGRYRMGVCADVPEGALFVAVRFYEPGAPSPTPEAKRRVATVLGRLVGAARPSRVELRTPKASARLPLLGGDWKVDKSGSAVHLGDRRSIRFVSKSGACDTLIEGATRSRPAFLPDVYFGQVDTRGIDGELGRYTLCLDAAKAILAEVDGPLSGGSPDDKRVAMLLEAVGGQILPAVGEGNLLALPTSGLSLLHPELKARRWVRTGEGEAPGGVADALKLPAHDNVTAMVRVAPGPCTEPGQNLRPASDHMEWLGWRRETGGPVLQHWCTTLYRGHVALTVARPAGHASDDAMYELMRGTLAAAQRKVGLIPNSGLSRSVLPSVGLSVDLPPGWSVRDGGTDQDFVENGVRGDGSRLALGRATGRCDGYLAELAAKGATDAAPEKYPAPAGWNARRLVAADGRGVDLCMDVGAGKTLVARLSPGKGDAEATFSAMTPVLAALAKKAGELVAAGE